MRKMQSRADGKTEVVLPVSASNSADQIVRYIRSIGDFFHSPDGEPYALVKRKTHREVWPVNSKEFRAIVEGSIYRQSGKAVPSRTTDAVLATLSAHARYEGATQAVHLRVARHMDRYYIDLCDDRWRVIEVDSKGWRILSSSPVMFTRMPTMRALAEPQPSRRFKPLLEYINIRKDDWILVLTWLIECFRPDTPYLGLSLKGPQGSAKSGTLDMLRDLVDPNQKNRRAKPKSREDLFVSAQNSHMLSYENLSGLSDDMQDGFCTILTGGGFSSRTLYTNQGESLISLKRPVLLNGIEPVVTRPDLLDRFICLGLPKISAERRRPEADNQQQFDEAKPLILGAILTYFSQALAELPEVKKQKLALPRMADFAQLGEAVMRAISKNTSKKTSKKRTESKMPSGKFIARFNQNRRSGVEQAIESSSLAESIRSYVTRHPDGIEGSYAEVEPVLLEDWLKTNGPNSKPGDWPKPGKAFGAELRRLEPALEQIGIRVTMGKIRVGYACKINGAVQV